jgi:hypothetical protein
VSEGGGGLDESDPTARPPPYAVRYSSEGRVASVPCDPAGGCCGPDLAPRREHFPADTHALSPLELALEAPQAHAR